MWPPTSRLHLRTSKSAKPVMYICVYVHTYVCINCVQIFAGGVCQSGTRSITFSIQYSTHDSPLNFDLALGALRLAKSGFKVQS